MMYQPNPEKITNERRSIFKARVWNEVTSRGTNRETTNTEWELYQPKEKTRNEEKKEWHRIEEKRIFSQIFFTWLKKKKKTVISRTVITHLMVFQWLDGGFEKENIKLVNGEIHETSDGMRYIWSEASSHDAMPRRSVRCIKFLTTQNTSQTSVLGRLTKF